jgi:hypothetical protein
MTLETDALAETAQRFSELIRAERATTLDALASERQAALQLIDALKAERGIKAQQASTRFVVGVALGVAAGVAAIYYVSRRASDEARLGIAAGPSLAAPAAAGGPSIAERFRRALEDGKRAAASHEQQLWQQYRDRAKDDEQQRKPDDLFY